MLMTDDKAREKWCPMARVARRENTEPDFSGDEVLVGGCNTDALGRTRVPVSCRCIASECAMWRKASIGNGLGYCGLAGRPELP